MKAQNSVYKSRQEIIQKYGYSDYAIWFQEESFFNYWQVHCNGRGVPLYEINLAKRQKMRGESKNQMPENYSKLQENDSIRFQCPYCKRKFSQKQNLKTHIETHKNKVDDNTSNENLHEHDEKEEAITNNNEIVDIPQVQIEVIEGIELNNIDWNNVEYIFVPEIVEKPTDTDPIQASCNQLDQAEAIEEPILEEIVDQNPEDNKTNNCEISDQDSSTVLIRTNIISKSPLKEQEFTCHHCNKVFSSEKNVELHITLVHEMKKPYKCSKCDFSFLQKEELSTHITSVHDMEKPYLQMLKMDFSFLQKEELSTNDISSSASICL